MTAEVVIFPGRRVVRDHKQHTFWKISQPMYLAMCVINDRHQDPAGGPFPTNPYHFTPRTLRALHKRGLIAYFRRNRQDWICLTPFGFQALRSWKWHIERTKKQ